MIEEFLKRATKTKKKKLAIDEKDDIETPFVRYAKSKGCIAYKLIILNRRGFPDRTVLIPGGFVFFIEFKRKNKPLQPTQIKIQELLVKLGFKYYICDEPGEAEKILDQIMDDLEWH